MKEERNGCWASKQKPSTLTSTISNNQKKWLNYEDIILNYYAVVRGNKWIATYVGLKSIVFMETVGKRTQSIE